MGPLNVTIIRTATVVQWKMRPGSSSAVFEQAGVGDICRKQWLNRVLENMVIVGER